MSESNNRRANSGDAGLKASALALDSAYLIAYAPSMFVDWMTPVPSASDCVGIRKLIDQFLWPMALDGIAHPILNRVRQGARSPVLPYRILITPLCETEHSQGFLAALRHHEQEPFDAENLAALKAAVGRLHRRFSARVDEVTGLLLWPDFQAEAASRSLHVQGACVAYMNLDQMHVVNEMTGFDTGDQLIREAGRLVRDELILTRSIATHLSGDRFVAVLFDHTLNQARHWAEQVRQRIEVSELCALNGVTASLGVAELSPEGSLHHALAAAETTCCIAKDRGRNRVELYVSGDDSVVRRHNAIGESREILEALDGDRLILHAQPIVKLTDVPSISHYEVLLRIQGEDGDARSISDLLPAADRYQLFERIDRWVLSKLLPLVAASGETLRAQGICLAVNVTGQSVSQPSFADFVRGEIRHRAIPAGVVEFELTETAAVRNVTATQRFIARMSEVGSRVALDDFGTGLSSLVHLKELDVHRIKIDGRFVRDVLTNERSRALIRALVQIADAIGLQTVAEFVESEEIATRVRELGVHCAQGYHYGRPVPLADLLQRLTATVGDGVSPDATQASAAAGHAA